MPVDADATLLDQPTQLAALTDLPVHLARPAIYRLQSASKGRFVDRRLAATAAIAAAPDVAAAFALLRKENFIWLIVLEGPPQFDPQGDKAAFKSGKFLVYRAASADGGE